jgi:hypothetical protein
MKCDNCTLKNDCKFFLGIEPVDNCEYFKEDEFELHKLTMMLDRCEDELKIALEYMEDHPEAIVKDTGLRSIKIFLTKFVREGGIDMLQAINCMLYLKEKEEEAKNDIQM